MVVIILLAALIGVLIVVLSPEPLPYEFLRGKTILKRGVRGSVRYLAIQEDFDSLVQDAKNELGASNVRLFTLPGEKNHTYTEAFLPSKDKSRSQPWLTDNLQIIESVLHPESIPDRDSDYPIVRDPDQTILVYFASESWLTRVKRWFQGLAK